MFRAAWDASNFLFEQFKIFAVKKFRRNLLKLNSGYISLIFWTYDGHVFRRKSSGNGKLAKIVGQRGKWQCFETGDISWKVADRYFLFGEKRTGAGTYLLWIKHRFQARVQPRFVNSFGFQPARAYTLVKEKGEKRKKSTLCRVHLTLSPVWLERI